MDATDPEALAERLVELVEKTNGRTEHMRAARIGGAPIPEHVLVKCLRSLSDEERADLARIAQKMFNDPTLRDIPSALKP